MGRSALKATVLRIDDVSDEWSVEATDSAEGGCYITLFSGPAALERAEEYARNQYGEFALDMATLPTARHA